MAINKLTTRDVTRFQRVRRVPSTMPRRNLMDLYQRMATKSAIYPGQGTPLGLAYVALKLNGEAGEFAEHVGKAMRDDALVTLGHKRAGTTRDAHMRPLTPDRRAALIKELGDVLWYLSAACNELGLTLSDVAESNLAKLADRSKRGKLRGSGDNR